MRNILALMAALFLSACVEGPPISTPPDMTFANLQPIQVNAAALEVVDNYKPPLHDPNIEHTFRLPTYTALSRLLHHQLVPAGGVNTLRAIIDDASVTRTKLPKDESIAGYFTHQATDRLEAKVLVRFELVDPKAPDIVLGHASVVAHREKTLTEEMSPAERDQAYFTLTDDLMNEVNGGLKSIVQNTFGKKF